MTTPPRSIAAINRLPQAEKERTYARIIPAAVFARYAIDPATLRDARGRRLAQFVFPEGSTSVEFSLKHAYDAEDPVLYGHLTDTISGQIHVLLYVVNDPESPRFNVDRMPDGSPTRFGVFKRNVPEEIRALEAGLAPGQVHRGLRLLTGARESFEAFVSALGQTMYFVEPLYYHNAIVFERYGFAYQRGRRWMEEINARFESDAELLAKLDGSSPFRQASAAKSIRGRSWAIHDGILGKPFTGVTMYKAIGKHAGVSTFPEAVW